MSDEIKAQSAQLTTNRLERRTLDGITYAVAPAVIVREMVLNGELLPEKDISAFVDSWNGRPVVLRHPKRDGMAISANRVSVLEVSGMGIVLNCRMDGNRLIGELWLNVGKCNELGGDALTTLQRMERGEVVELSSAYFCDLEAIPGAFNGNAYTGIQRNLRPDHVALLPDEVGACSVRDGCGTPRTNQCNCNMEKKVMTENQEVKASEPVAVAPAPVVNAQPVAVTLPPEVAAFQAMIAGFGGLNKIQEALQSITVNASRQRDELIGRIKTNQQCALTDDMLKAMPLEALDALDRTLRPVDYAGRGGVRANQQQDESEWEAYKAPEAKKN